MAKAAIKVLIGLCIVGAIAIYSWQSFQASQFQRTEIAVIYNEADPLSSRVANYYREQRGIVAENLIAVRFNPNSTGVSPEEFQKIKAEVDAKTPKDVQFYALAWTSPYSVGCMSITSAFTFGYDAAYCGAGCVVTKPSLYFNSLSSSPYTDFKIRPTMIIPFSNFIEARALIDCGVASDQSFPTGTAYLLSTSDPARNVRSVIYPRIAKLLGDRFKIEIIKSDVLENKKDVMFYFTGLAKVEKLKTNQFLAGAIADHLTSFGGQLTNSSQMSSLEWIRAGATGSYGTVVEPCNFPQKFPNPGMLMSYYLRGDRLIEAYWKSVEQPGQGVFIGEPLASPFRSKF